MNFGEHSGRDPKHNQFQCYKNRHRSVPKYVLVCEKTNKQPSKFSQTLLHMRLSKTSHSFGYFGFGFLIFEDCVPLPLKTIHDVSLAEKKKDKHY